MAKTERSEPAAHAVGIPVQRMVRPVAEARPLVERLRLHDDERLYEEADILMSEAADEIERQRNNADNFRQQVEDKTVELQRLRADAMALRELLRNSQTAVCVANRTLVLDDMPGKIAEALFRTAYLRA